MNMDTHMNTKRMLKTIMQIHTAMNVTLNRKLEIIVKMKMART